MTFKETDSVQWRGPFEFADRPIDEVPRAAAGVYTVWDRQTLIYVGMSGRGKSAADLAKDHAANRRAGLWTRLNSHASGRRSGDQFCVYIQDRFLLFELGHDQIAQVAEGQLRMDDLVRDFVRSRLSFRFTLVEDGKSAELLERTVRSGSLGVKPVLNPL